MTTLVAAILEALGDHEGHGCCDPRTLDHVVQTITRIERDRPRCAFVYTSAEQGGTPCPFTVEQHPLLHEWLPIIPDVPYLDSRGRPDPRNCLTSCGCDGRRRASECSGPYPPDSPVDGCRRCRR